MSELKVLRRENAKLRLTTTALHSRVRELEDALALCKQRYGIDIRAVLEYVVDEHFDAADFARALDGDGRDGPSVERVADVARQMRS